MNKVDVIERFIIFYLEAYKKQKNISGVEALEDFKKYNVFDFLEAGFEVLHTQSEKYVTDEIIDFINQRK